MALIMLIIIFFTSLWVYTDCKKISYKYTNSMGPVGWFWCCIFFWIISFPFYLISRNGIKEESAKHLTKTENKKCPECAELVKVEATKCRFCGHAFQDTQKPEKKEAEAKFEADTFSKRGIDMKKLVIVLFAILTSNHSHAKTGLMYEGKTLLDAPKTKCEIFFRSQALVVVYCPKNTNWNDAVEDFKAIEAATKWPMPVFDVFTDKTKTPKTMSQYEKLPEVMPYQPITVQIQNGAVIEKTCQKGLSPAFVCPF